MKNVALITGVTGQDGSYLAEFLLEKGYEVHGVVRRSSSINTWRLDGVYEDPHFYLHYGDVSDPSVLASLIINIAPTEIYNLAAQSHVKVSFEQPCFTSVVNGVGTIGMLDAIRQHAPKAKFYQASSSEMFGRVVETPQTERTPFRPQSPYACAKIFAYWATCNYREAYDLFAVNGILFNHESERRGETFVTRKVTRAIARIEFGLQDTVILGNLDACRDWGYAPDYVEAMWLMLQYESPEDFVIATGESHTVREFVKAAFDVVGRSWEKHVRIDPRYFRPTEVAALQGDASKARRLLGWTPKVVFHDLVRRMVLADLELVRRECFGTQNPHSKNLVSAKKSLTHREND
jgi:GDPmannose 4,6-dehydratase